MGNLLYERLAYTFTLEAMHTTQESLEDIELVVLTTNDVKWL